MTPAIRIIQCSKKGGAIRSCLSDGTQIERSYLIPLVSTSKDIFALNDNECSYIAVVTS